MNEPNQNETESHGFASDARKKAIEAYDGAREGVASAGRKTTDAIDDAPLLALAGGLAVGALVAALLPRTEAESKALRPVGDKLSVKARAAAEAAKEAGNNRLKELGLTADAGIDTLRSIFEGAGDAARTSAKAAAGAVRKE